MSGLEKIFLVAAGFGIVTEIVARLFRFWLYRNAVSPILNIVGMFGVVQGVCIAGLIGRGQPLLSIAPVLFMTGATIGIAYEGLNEFALHGWTWPEGRLLGLSAARDKAAAIGVTWGLVPVLTTIAVRYWP